MTGAYRERSALPFVPRVSKVVPRHIQYRFTYVSAGPSLLVTIKEVCLLALSFERIQNRRDDNIRARSLDRWRQDCDEQIAEKYQDAEAGSRNVEILQRLQPRSLSQIGKQYDQSR